MSNQELDQIAEQLRQSGKYRIIDKYQQPKGYNTASSTDKKLIGVFLDIESTGLSHTIDKLLELGMVKFEYTEDGRIFNLLEEFNGYQDPKIPIPEHITKLTGITNDMVKDHSIENSKVAEYLEDVDIIISHNAQFDRAFFETAFPDIVPKAWACSMRNIDWSNEDISSFKLEYIAYRYNFFYEGHRAIIDCLAGIHVLAQNLLNSKQLVLKHLMV
jgi:DNA polymerase-3 subunit epsilon